MELVQPSIVFEEAPPIHGAFYALCGPALRGFSKLSRCQITGQDRIPADGPVLLAPNHISLWDPPLVSALAKRPVTTVGKAELFVTDRPYKRPFVYFLQRTGTFPVERGKVTRHFLRMLEEAVEERGDIVSIFPEGTRTRTGELGPAAEGYGKLVLKLDLPIVPVHLSGHQRQVSGRRFYAPPFRIAFGEPFRVSDLRSLPKKEAADLAAHRVMAAIAALAP